MFVFAKNFKAFLVSHFLKFLQNYSIMTGSSYEASYILYDLFC